MIAAKKFEQDMMRNKIMLQQDSLSHYDRTIKLKQSELDALNVFDREESNGLTDEIDQTNFLLT